MIIPNVHNIYIYTVDKSQVDSKCDDDDDNNDDDGDNNNDDNDNVTFLYYMKRIINKED
jgi:hypothetical protein